MLLSEVKGGRMAYSSNGNAICTKYSHFKSADRQWSTDISYNCLIDVGNGLIRIVKVLTLSYIFTQDLFELG